MIPYPWMIEELERRRQEREELEREELDRPRLWIEVPPRAPEPRAQPEPERPREPIVIELW